MMPIDGSATENRLVDFRYINLTSRPDRRNAIRKNLALHDFYPSGKRIAASSCPRLPSLGCSRSHYLAIADLLSKSEAEFLMVLEDDWRFSVRREFLEEAIVGITSRYPAWNVLQLSATDSVFDPLGAIEVQNHQIQLARLFRATSTAAYVVRRDFALTLNSYFADAISMSAASLTKLAEVNSQYYSPGGNLDTEVARQKLALMSHATDYAWSRGQLQHVFLGAGVEFGFCDNSASDISPFTTDNRDRQLWQFLDSSD